LTRRNIGQQPYHRSNLHLRHRQAKADKWPDGFDHFLTIWEVRRRQYDGLGAMPATVHLNDIVDALQMQFDESSSFWDREADLQSGAPEADLTLIGKAVLDSCATFPPSGFTGRMPTSHVAASG